MAVSYSSEADYAAHRAVLAAAAFIQSRRECFPGERVPTAATGIAVLAIKAYGVFLARPESDEATALAIIEASRRSLIGARSPGRVAGGGQGSGDLQVGRRRASRSRLGLSSEARTFPYGRQHICRCGVGAAGVERRLRCVLDVELDSLCGHVASKQRCELKRAVDACCDTRCADEVAVDDNA